MNKAFEKIIEKLEEREVQAYAKTDTDAAYTAYRNAIEIVEQTAIEYNNGWILCSDMVPSDCEIHEVTAQFSSGRNYTEFAYYDEEMEEWWKFDDDVLLNVVAWKEQSEPYKHDGD